VPKIKGTHMAMQSAMVAADAVFDLLGVDANSENPPNEATAYPEKLKKTWLWDELYTARNIRPAFKWGLWGGLAYSAIDTYLFRGKAPWTMRHHADHDQLLAKENAPRINYPKPDGVLTFDRLSSVFLSSTNHEENQRCHLQLQNPEVAMSVNFARYGSPETRYCPAGVYEIVGEEAGAPKLQINAQNCLHCKTCDIKDPTQNINWTVPEGSGGPNYSTM